MPGGYESEYLGREDEFVMIDEINVKASFKAGSKIRSYRLDLDRMELSKDYFEYDPHMWDDEDIFY